MTGAELPKSWEKCMLGEIVDVLDSRRVPINNEERAQRIAGKSADQLYPYYGATGQVGVIDGFLFDEPLVLLGEDGVAFFDQQRTKAYQVSGKTWVNNHAHVLRASNGISTNAYVRHYLNAFEYEGYATGTTRLKLTQEAMRRIPLPLPPLAEQIRIADKLDALLARVEAGRERLERVPKLLKRFRQSVLSAAVSGELTREWREHNDVKVHSTGIEWPGEVPAVELPTGWIWTIPEKIKSSERYSLAIGPFGSNLVASEYQSEGVPLIFVREIRARNFSLPTAKFITSEKASELSAHAVRPGDLLITKMGDPPGDTAIYPEDRPAAVITSDCIKLTVDAQHALTQYLFYAFEGPEFRSRLSEITAGVAQQKISLERFRGFPLQLPPLAEQAEIVRRVEALFAIADRIEAKYAAALSSFDRLTPALLAKAFRGELVPQDPNDEPASVLLERIRATRETEGGKRGRGRPAKAAAGGSGDGGEVKRRGRPPGANAQAGAEGAEPRRRGRPPKVRGAVSEPDAQPAAVPEAVEASAAPRGRGRPPGAGIPQASSFEDALRKLEEQKLARTQGTRQVGLFGDTED